MGSKEEHQSEHHQPGQHAYGGGRIHEQPTGRVKSMVMTALCRSIKKLGILPKTVK
jgi:hypothetical protein